MAERKSSIPAKRQLLAYTLPMLVFVLLLGFGSALKRPGGSLWLAAPEFWIYPLQTLLCAGLLIYFRREYEPFGWRRLGFALGIGLLVFLLWIAPQQFLHFPARRVGFNPEVFAGEPAFYRITIGLRFLRLVVVVPFVEEIFWRGFLLRYFISEKFTSVPFGTFHRVSFVVVTLAFGLSHSMADWPAALITSALYNLVAYRTRNLGACVTAHALTNLLLGLWILTTGQWGFW